MADMNANIRTYYVNLVFSADFRRPARAGIGRAAILRNRRRLAVGPATTFFSRHHPHVLKIN